MNKTKLKERKDFYYAKQSQNAKGLHIEQPDITISKDTGLVGFINKGEKNGIEQNHNMGCHSWCGRSKNL
jgi:hypothetical protein